MDIHPTTARMFTETGHHRDFEEMEKIDLPRLQELIADAYRIAAATGRPVRVGIEVTPIIDVDWLDGDDDCTSMLESNSIV